MFATPVGWRRCWAKSKSWKTANQTKANTDSYLQGRSKADCSGLPLARWMYSQKRTSARCFSVWSGSSTQTNSSRLSGSCGTNRSCTLGGVVSRAARAGNVRTGTSSRICTYHSPRKTGRARFCRRFERLLLAAAVSGHFSDRKNLSTSFLNMHSHCQKMMFASYLHLHQAESCEAISGFRCQPSQLRRPGNWLRPARNSSLEYWAAHNRWSLNSVIGRGSVFSRIPAISTATTSIVFEWR